MSRLVGVVTVLVLIVAGCGSAAPADADLGLRQVSVTDASQLLEDAADDLVVLDVRTPEEFDAGHLEDAVMVDFYRDDFASLIGELDPNVPYLLYCRSGNRSGQTLELMRDLGFTNVADIDGGILEWDSAGLPTIP